MRPKTTRNEDICRLVLSGEMPLGEIAKKHGISKARVSQIAARNRGHLLAVEVPLETYFALLKEGIRRGVRPEQAASCLLADLLGRREAA